MYFMDWTSSVADSCKLQVPANTAGFEAGILEGLARSIEKQRLKERGLEKQGQSALDQLDEAKTKIKELSDLVDELRLERDFWRRKHNTKALELYRQALADVEYDESAIEIQKLADQESLNDKG